MVFVVCDIGVTLFWGGLVLVGCFVLFSVSLFREFSRFSSWFFCLGGVVLLVVCGGWCCCWCSFWLVGSCWFVWFVRCFGGWVLVRGCSWFVVFSSWSSFGSCGFGGSWVVLLLLVLFLLVCAASGVFCSLVLLTIKLVVVFLVRKKEGCFPSSGFLVLVYFSAP